MKYRVVELTYLNGEKWYKIQTKKNWHSFYRNGATFFTTKKDAKEHLKIKKIRAEKERKANTIKSTRIV